MRTLIGLSLALLLASLNTSIANIALPELQNAFDTSIKASQQVITYYIFTISVFVLIIGRLSDLYSRSSLLKIGLGLFFIASLGAGLAPNFSFLLFARALQGLAAAILTVLSMVLLNETAPTQSVGRAMGIFGTFSSIGTALGPLLGGFLIEFLNWRFIFLVNLPLVALSFYFVRGLYKSNPYKKTKNSGNKALLKIKTHFTMNFLVTCNQMASLIIGPFYLSQSLGLNLFEAGLVLSTGSITAAILGFTGGWLVDKFGRYKVLFSGIFCILLGCFLFSQLQISSGLLGYLTASLSMAAGYAIFLAANNTLAMQTLASHFRGRVSGLMNLSRNLGLLAGASIMGALFAHASTTSNKTLSKALKLSQENPAPQEILHGLNFTFSIGCALITTCLLIAISSYYFKTHKPQANNGKIKKSAHKN